MELEVNKSHKKLDLSKIKQPLKRISAGALVSLCIFTGMNKAEAVTDYNYEQPTTTIETVDEDVEVDIPRECKRIIQFQLGKSEYAPITQKDLEVIEYLNVSVEDNTDLSFLTKFPRLKDLTFTSLSENTINLINNMPKIDTLESLTIYNMFLNIDLTKENTKFLQNNPNIKYLEIDGITLHPGVEENFKSLETIRLGQQENIDIDFSKLTNLKALDVRELAPYTLAMHFNNEEYKTLTNSGVEVIFAEGQEEKYLRANKKLDEIVSSLNVTKESTDREKLDAILLYTLSNLTYDEEIYNLTEEELYERDLENEFYKDGLLYAIVEKDTAICGNYAALVESLSDRLGNPKDSYYMTSNEHAWNLMNIDGELFYVDSTWLDNQIIFENENINGFETLKAKTSEEKIALGEGEEVPWYMENPDSFSVAMTDPTGSHIPNLRIPTYMTDNQKHYYFDYNVNDFGTFSSSQKLTVKVNDEKKETTLGEMIGAMVGFGLAVSVANMRKNKQKDEENKNNRKTK